MRKVTMSVSLLFMGIFLLSSTAMAKRCTDWRQNQWDPVSIQICENSNGGSGTAEIKNTGNSRARVCYKLNFNSGNSYNGCNTLYPGATTKVACFRCAERNGGVDTWEVESYKRK